MFDDPVSLSEGSLLKDHSQKVINIHLYCMKVYLFLFYLLEKMTTSVYFSVRP